MVDVSELLALTSERVGRELTRLLSGENQKKRIHKLTECFHLLSAKFVYHLSLTVALIVILKKTDCQG